MQIRRVVGLVAALALLVWAVPTVAQRNNNQQQQQQQRTTADPDTVTLVRLVEAVSTGQPAPTDIPVTWESNHFVKGQAGVTYIPFTLSVDRSQLASY